MAQEPVETLRDALGQMNIHTGNSPATFTVPGEDYCESLFEFVKGKRFEAIYKGRRAINKTRTARPAFELTGDGAVKDDLKLLKTLLNAKKVWSGVSDPDMDPETYTDPWRTTVWMTHTATSTLAQDSECTIELTGCKLVKYDGNAEWDHGLEITYNTVD